MNKDYDEVISDMLIQLDSIEKSLERLNERMDKADKRIELTIKRMVEMQSKLNKYFLDYIKKIHLNRRNGKKRQKEI